MTYIIRKTLVSDVSKLPDIERSASQLFKSTIHLSWIADAQVIPFEDHKKYAELGLSWVAQASSSEIIAGFIVAEAIQNDLYIAEVSVRKNHQKQGIGSKLIQAVIKAAVDLKKSSITLTTFNDIPWNAPYYKTLGFDVIPPTDLPTYLREKLKHETDAGLKSDQRCAMRRSNIYWIPANIGAS